MPTIVKKKCTQKKKNYFHKCTQNSLYYFSFYSNILNFHWNLLYHGFTLAIKLLENFCIQNGTNGTLRLAPFTIG
jgi:hypothetical protein